MTDDGVQPRLHASLTHLFPNLDRQANEPAMRPFSSFLLLALALMLAAATAFVGPLSAARPRHAAAAATSSSRRSTPVMVGWFGECAVASIPL